jgi:hypothetical protein
VETTAETTTDLSATKLRLTVKHVTSSHIMSHPVPATEKSLQSTPTTLLSTQTPATRKLTSPWWSTALT